MPEWRGWYLGGRDPADPVASPARADLAGLPPLYVQAGGAEGLRKQIRAFVEKARAQGVEATLDEWEHMSHVFQSFGPALSQSAEALGRIGREIGRRAGGGRP
ncbi:MAG: alpha/beta hydrolase [Deltaproteobacteria bacterium]|nr:alpha/beta hydrolase [Deltaproteobacteria bacterium]